MRNAQNTRKTIVLTLAALSLAVGLLSMAGCRNALQPHGGPEGTVATGYLSLTIGSGNARTIFTAIELEDIDAFSFDLELVHLQDAANNLSILDWDRGSIGNMVPGDWTLSVTAFLPNPDGGGLVAAARTAVPVPFAVNPGQTTYLSAVYVLPLPGGEGWFSWDLVLPPSASGWIRVTDLYGVQMGDGVDAGVPGRISLPAGQHRANLALSLDGTDITISRLLNVYAGMTSHWSEAFTPGDFRRSFLDFFLELWDGFTWDLSEVQAGHFGILRTDEGIEGVYAHNIVGIRHWFNAIHRLSGHPGYNTADCLGALVDAALVGIGAQEFFANEFDGAQDDAEAVISGFVRNGTGMTFEWLDNRVFATIGGRYVVEIYVHFLVPEPLAITFYGNGYTGPTLPEPVYAFAGQEIELPVWHADRLIGDYWFAFRGWNTHPGGIIPEFLPGENFVTRDYEVALFAVWSEYGFGFDDGAITGFSGGSTDIVIPHEINGVDVSSIGEGAFADHQLSSVHIPWGLTHIAYGAFANNPLSSISIPGGVSIYDLGWDHTMGIHGDSFLAFYNNTGRRAGTYLWLEAESRWIFYGDTGGAAFEIRFTGFRDGEADIGFDQSLSILSPEALISVVGDFDEFRWIHDGAIVPDATGASIDFRALHGNRMGVHFVSVEVRRGDRWYGSRISILVTM